MLGHISLHLFLVVIYFFKSVIFISVISHFWVVFGRAITSSYLSLSGGNCDIQLEFSQARDISMSKGILTLILSLNRWKSSRISISSLFILTTLKGYQIYVLYQR